MKLLTPALALLVGLYGFGCAAKDTPNTEWPGYNNGFDGQRYSALTGRRVSIVVGDRRESGVVKGIDAGGALLLDIGERVEWIVAGEVSLEGVYE